MIQRRRMLKAPPVNPRTYISRSSIVLGFLSEAPSLSLLNSWSHDVTVNAVRKQRIDNKISEQTSGLYWSNLVFSLNYFIKMGNDESTNSQTHVR